MRAVIIASILLPTIASGVAGATELTVVFSGAQKRNNLVTELLEVASISEPGRAFTFTRPDDGWVFLTARRQGKGTVRIGLDERPGDDAVVCQGRGRADRGGVPRGQGGAPHSGATAPAVAAWTGSS